YIVSVERKRNSEKPNIEEACTNYIELINKYAVVPENIQNLYNEQISSEEKTKAEEDFKKAISRTNGEA
ncbi:MAG: hypothetical protein K2H53_06235, partial [Clostridia bacterium]|nr:hypothetical protein [Clostridia bacterium]